MQRAIGAVALAGPWPVDSYPENDLAEPAGTPRAPADPAGWRPDGEEIEAVVAWPRASDEGEPPRWVAHGGGRIARRVPSGRSARLAPWRRLVATVAHDNRTGLRPAGARTVGGEQLRLMYQAGGVEIDLEVGQRATDGRLRMLGHVSDGEADLAGARVIAEGPSGRIEADIDELGQFALDGLVAGAYRVELGLPSELIEIPEVWI